MARGRTAAAPADQETQTSPTEALGLIAQGADAFASAIIGAFTLVVRAEIQAALAGNASPLVTATETTQPPRVRRAEPPKEPGGGKEEEEEDDPAKPEQTVVAIGRGPKGARTTIKPADSTDTTDADAETVQIDIDGLKTKSRNELKPIAEALGIATAGMKADAMREEILKVAHEKGMIGDRKGAPVTNDGDDGDDNLTQEQIEEVAEDTERPWEERKAAALEVDALVNEPFAEESLDEMVAFFDENAKHPDVKKHFKEVGCDQDCFNCAVYFQDKCFKKFNQG